MTDLFSQQQPQQPGSAPVRTRAASRNNPAARRRRKQRRLRLAAVLVVALVIVGGAGIFLADKLPDLFAKQEAAAVDFPGPGEGEVLVSIPRGASTSAIGAALVDAGVVGSQQAFREALTAHAQETGSEATLSYGTYSLLAGMPAADALAAMLDSRNLKQDGVTVPEGRTVAWTIERLSTVTGIPLDDFEAALEDPEALGLPEAADGNPEGWLAPATYPYTDETTAVDLLATMVAKQRTVIGDLEISEDDAMTALTKASIVEAEAPASAFAKVARVIENRIDQGWTLDMDSTIHFIFERSEDMTTTAEQRQVDDPYNTYRFPGLPPGPINSPGKAALEAVLDPEPGDWMFFVTVNGETGETVFSVTNDEHNLARLRYQEWLREYNARATSEEGEGE